MKAFWTMVIILTVIYIIYYTYNIYKDLRVRKNDSKHPSEEEFSVTGYFAESPQVVTLPSEQENSAQQNPEPANKPEQDMTDPFAVTPPQQPYAPAQEDNYISELTDLLQRLPSVPTMLFDGITVGQLADEFNDPVKRSQSQIIFETI